MIHSKTLLVSLLDESEFLNESLKTMIQWFTQRLYLFHYWMNQRFWINLLKQWFNDSLINTSLVSLVDESAFLNKSLKTMIQWLAHKHFTCFISGWISIFEQISWKDDSMIHSKTLLVSLLDESAFLNESLKTMIQWLTHKDFTCFFPGFCIF